MKRTAPALPRPPKGGEGRGEGGGRQGSDSRPRPLTPTLSIARRRRAYTPLRQAGSALRQAAALCHAYKPRYARLTPRECQYDKLGDGAGRRLR